VKTDVKYTVEGFTYDPSFANFKFIYDKPLKDFIFKRTNLDRNGGFKKGAIGIVKNTIHFIKVYVAQIRIVAICTTHKGKSNSRARMRPPAMARSNVNGR